MSDLPADPPATENVELPVGDVTETGLQRVDPAEFPDYDEVDSDKVTLPDDDYDEGSALPDEEH